MPLPRRVVVTGLGLMTPLGLDRPSFWQALMSGRCAIRRLQGFDPSALPFQLGAEIDDFDARNYLEKKDRKRINAMPRTMQLAVAAAAQAANDAKLREVPPDPTRYGTVFGSGVIPAPEDLGPAAHAATEGRRGPVDPVAWGSKGIPNVPPMWLLNCIPNVTTGHVSILQGGQGPNNTLTMSEAASLFALAEGYRLVGRDRADVVMVGGADTHVLPFQFARHCVFGKLSPCDDPARACLPFDRRRSGTVAGEGGVAMVLEDEEHARKRGVPVLAEVLGTGAAFDRSLDGRGLARAIRLALEQAEVKPDDIDHVNAHGLATVDSDRREARALQEVFGDDGPPVLAAKSYFGNLGAGSSLAELAVSLLAFEQGTLPPTLHYEEPDPECRVRVLTQPRRVERPHVLKVGFTDVGQCVAVVFRRY